MQGDDTAMFIAAVAGMIASGKSTVAEVISQALDCPVLPESKTALSLLPDFLADTKSWAFEVQLGFLCEKSLGILDINDAGKDSLVVERTISEDVEIFADYWLDRGDIDPRSYAIYSRLANHFRSLAPPPSVVIYCICGLDEITRRIEARQLAFEKLYPPHHIETLYNRYKSWLSNYPHPAVFDLDTESVDLTDREVASAISEDIRAIAGSFQATNLLAAKGALPPLRLVNPHI